MEWLAISGVSLLTLMLIAMILGLTSCKSVVQTNYSDKKVKKAMTYYYLPETLIKIKAFAKVAVVYRTPDNTLFGAGRLVEHSFTVTTEIVSDKTNLLALNHQKSDLSSDDIKFGVNAKGLLETVNVTAEDRSAELVAILTKAPQVILGSTAGATKAAGTTVKIKDFNAEFTIRASDLTPGKIVPWKITLVNELGVDEPPQSVTADFTVTRSGLPVTTPPATGKVTTPPTTMTLDSMLKIITEDDLVNDTNKTVDGILTRPLANWQLEITSSDILMTKALPVNVAVIDQDRLVVVPVRRATFVKQVNKIAIADGMITSNEINRPSSFEGFITIPINIAKAIVSIPAQLISFRIDNTKKQNELETEKLKLEKSILESEKFKLQREGEIQKVLLELQTAEKTRAVALDEIKFKLEKSLLDAETLRVKSEKDLLLIKEELEKLKKPKP